MARGKEYVPLAILFCLCFEPGHSAVGLLKGESGAVKINDIIMSPNTCQEYHSYCGVTFFELDRVQTGCQHAVNLKMCLEASGCRLKEMELWDDYVDKVCAGGMTNGGRTIIPPMGIMILVVAISIFMA